MTEGFKNELDGDTAAQLRIGGMIDISHAARSDVTRDLVMCEPASDHAVNENLPADSIRIRRQAPASPNCFMTWRNSAVIPSFAAHRARYRWSSLPEQR